MAVNYYGPVDVTDYDAWKTLLTAGVTAGSCLCPVIYGTTVIFIEVTSS